MARPQKNNLDYFSHDKDMRNDLKIKALRRKFSHKGYSIYVMMLEHLSNCEYLQYEWNELSIELLTSDFDIDTDELIEIINYSVKLKLFEIEVGYIYCANMLVRNQHILSERKCFDLNNSPITKLKRDLLSKSPINSGETEFLGSKTEISTHSIVKESIVKESIVKESIVKESKEQESKEQDSKEQDSIEKNSIEKNSKEEQIKRKYNIGQDIKVIFKSIPNIIKLIEVNDLDAIERKDKFLFNTHYNLITEYQAIKL